MFFVARSIVCIGLVVSALPVATKPGASLTEDVLPMAAGSSAAGLERYCAQNPARCLQAVRAAVEPAPLVEGAPARKLHSLAPPQNLRS